MPRRQSAQGARWHLPGRRRDRLSGDAPDALLRKLDGSYQVSKELRDMVVFAPQNLLRDPPFSRLDLVSCRNFLIYLEPDAQQKIIALCHFALRQGGHLFLGNAETIGRHEDLFETVSKKWRIYRRLGSTRHDLIEYPPPRAKSEPRRWKSHRHRRPSRMLRLPKWPVALCWSATLRHRC
jgi:hypothetical protein